MQIIDMSRKKADPSQMISLDFNPKRVIQLGSQSVKHREFEGKKGVVVDFLLVGYDDEMSQIRQAVARMLLPLSTNGAAKLIQINNIPNHLNLKNLLTQIVKGKVVFQSNISIQAFDEFQVEASDKLSKLQNGIVIGMKNR